MASITSRTTANRPHPSSKVSATKGPKQCKCYALSPGESCHGIPYGLDLMSQSTLMRITTATRDRKFQIDLQNHTKRMGWGVPMKPNKKKEEEESLGGRSKGSKLKSLKGGRPKMPVLHRARSSQAPPPAAAAAPANHPNHGSLDASATTAVFNPGEEGGKWWEANFDQNVSPHAPLPPTSSNVAAAVTSVVGATPADDILGMEIGGVKPLPEIAVDANPGDNVEYSALDSLDSQTNNLVNADAPPSSTPPTTETLTSAFDDHYDPSLITSQPPPSPPPTLDSNMDPHSDIGNSFALEQMVDAALFASWRSLPWQSRVCPRTLEERESVRLLAGMVQERRRMGAWVTRQNEVAMEAAVREDGRFGTWVRSERERVRLEEEEEEERIKKFENEMQAAVVVRETKERIRVDHHIEEKERARVAMGTFKEFVTMRSNLHMTYDDDHASQEEIDAEAARQSQWAHDEMTKVTYHTAGELTRSLGFEIAEKDRVFEKELRYAHRTNGKWAASVARSTNVANDEDEVALEMWGREVRRVDEEDVEETQRVTAWETLQAAIKKAARANVLRLLAPDTAVVDYEDEVERAKYYCDAFKARAREEKNKFTKQRYLASKEAVTTRRKWKSALAKWRESTVAVHEKRRTHERERVMANLRMEQDRLAKRTRTEADRVDYAWEREVQRVKKWRETEQGFVKDLLAEWARGSADGDKAFKAVAQKAFDELEGGRNKVLARKLQSDFFANELKTKLDEKLALEADRVAVREKQENENVAEFESAQLLMVMGVSEQLAKIANNLFLSFTKELIDGNLKTNPDVMSSEVGNFAKLERGRIGVSYRIETERVAKAAADDERGVKAEMDILVDFCAAELKNENVNVAAWHEQLLQWSDELHAALLAGNKTWFEEQEKIGTNEMLRMWGADIYKRGMELPEPPNHNHDEHKSLFSSHHALQQMAHGEVDEVESAGKPGLKPPPGKSTKLVPSWRTVRRLLPKPSAPTCEDGIGKKVSVYWADDKEWFNGVVDDFSEAAGGWHVTYGDGDEEWIDHRPGTAAAKDFRWPEIDDAEDEYEEVEEEFEEEVEVEVEEPEMEAEVYPSAAVTSLALSFTCDVDTLNAWRCKCTILMLEARMDTLNREVERQGGIRSEVLRGLVVELKSGMEAKHEAMMTEFRQQTVVEVTRVLERVANEGTRVVNRHSMELKSWEQFVTAIELMTRNNFSYSENIVNQLLSWQTTAFASVKVGHIKIMRGLLTEDKKQAVDTSTYREQDFRVSHGRQMSGVAKLGDAYVAQLEEKWRGFEEVIEREAAVITDFAAAAVGGIRKTSEDAIQKGKDTAAQFEQAVGEQLEKAAGGGDEGTLEGLVKFKEGVDAYAASFEIEQLVTQFDEAAGKIVKLAAEKSEVGAKELAGFHSEVGALVEKMLGGGAGGGELGEMVEKLDAERGEKLRQEREKEVERYRKSSELIREKLEVLDRETRFEGNKKTSAQRLLFEKMDEARNMLLKEDCMGFDELGEEFKAAVEGCVGNCVLEEQKRVVGRVVMGRKERLEGVAALSKQTLLDELNRQGLLVVSWVEEHIGELRKLWRDYEGVYEEIKKEWEVEEGAWVATMGEELRAEGVGRGGRFRESVGGRVEGAKEVARGLGDIESEGLSMEEIKGHKEWVGQEGDGVFRMLAAVKKKVEGGIKTCEEAIRAMKGKEAAAAAEQEEAGRRREEEARRAREEAAAGAAAGGEGGV